MAHWHRSTPRKALASGLVVVLAVSGCAGADEPADGPADDTGPTTAVTDPAPPATEPPTTDPPVTEPPATDPPVTDPAGPTTAPGLADEAVREVPGEYPTIQAAVDAAEPRDLVLIQPGTYVESVDVITDELTIRGVDRDSVVLDGELELANGIRVLGATGVVVENLTATNYANNGVFWVSSQGYRASFVTTYRTGDYGIYAFDSVGGQIEHSHTVGSRDAGVYIGQCFPCDAVVDDVVSSHNGLGYQGTNAGGNLLIVNSVWHDNRIGMLPNSGSYELCYPQRETTMIGNLVYANNQADTPAINIALLYQGNGILVAGGIGNVIDRNRVHDHDRTGLGLVPYLERTPNDDIPPRDEWGLSCEEQKRQDVAVVEDPLQWESIENVVTGNVVTESREADLAVASLDGDVAALGNCWGGNEFTTSAPTDLEALAPCGGAGAGGDWTDGDLGIARWYAEQADLPPEVDWREAPLPELGPHENMPDPAGSPPRPATDVPFDVDLDAITVPDLP